MTTLFDDLRVAARSCRRAPGFTALVVLTLAVGIGGAVAMFSVVDGVLFAELPYRDSDRMAVIWNRHDATGADKIQISGPDFVDYRDQATSFAELAFIHNATDNTLTDGARAEQVDVGYVSANFFDFLGVGAVVGRTFGRDDDVAAGEGVIGPAVISHALWARRYGADAGVIGRTVYLSGTPVQILGVMPADFRLVLPYAQGGAMSAGANDVIDVWRILPDRSFPRMPRSMAVVRALGRLAPGISFAQARDEFDRLAASLRAEHRVHEERRTAIEIVPLRSEVVGHVRAIVLTLFGAVGLVLLIASANVASLVSVEGNRRARDVAVRMAIGAGRGRILRQLFTQYALLAVLGALSGVALAEGLLRAIIGLAPASVPLLDRVGLDARALGFAILVTSAATLLFGVWPALRAAGTAPSPILSAASRVVVGHGNRYRNAMVVMAIALSMVLVAAFGLLARSFLEIQRASLGFEAAPVWTARVSLGHSRFADEALRRRYWDSLRRAMADDPALQSAGLVWPLPFTGQGVEIPYDSTGDDAPDWGRFVAFTANALPGYLETMQATVLDGRVFDERDLDRAGELVVVDDLVAARLYPGGRAVGRPIWIEDFGTNKRRPAEIIGVVSHLRHSRVTGSEREVIYRLLPTARNLAIVARAGTGAGAESAITALRRITESLDADVPTFDERPLAAYVDDQVAPTRFTMTLAAVFSVAALLMAVVGLYGVISYAIAQRTGELGLRMALGAGAGSILGLVMRRGLLLTAAGLLTGAIMSLGAARLIRGLLVEVPANDPLTFGMTALVLATAALGATYLPARRAAKLDPVTALREE